MGNGLSLSPGSTPGIEHFLHIIGRLVPTNLLGATVIEEADDEASNADRNGKTQRPALMV